MKRTLSAVALVAASSFAFDQYAPIAPKTIEVDLGYGYAAGTGYYDVDGEKQDLEGSPAVQTPSLQIKYGIIPGLDIEASAAFELDNEDASPTGEAVSGLTQPEIGVKYGHPEIGAGAFVNVIIPAGGKDIVGDEPSTTIELGGIYNKVFGQVGVNAIASYGLQLENADKYKQDVISVLAQGQYNVNEQVGPYLAVGFDKALEASFDGESVKDSDSQLLTVIPGLNYKANDKISAELSVPVTVMGKNAGAGWGIAAGFYYTIGL